MKNLLSILLAMFVGVSVVGCREDKNIVRDSIESIVVVADGENNPLGYGVLVEKAESKELEIITSCSILRIELSNGFRFENHPKILFEHSDKSFSSDLKTDIFYDICVLKFRQIPEQVFAQTAKFNTFSPKIGDKVFSAAWILDPDTEVAEFSIFQEYKVIVYKRYRHQGALLYAHTESIDFYPLSGAGVFNKDGKLVGIITNEGPTFFSEVNFNYEEYSK